MKRSACLALLLLLLLAAAVPSARAADGPTVRFDTSLGAIDVRLLPDDAPNTVATFLRYVADRRYDSSYLHRSVADFIIQGGGYRSVDNQTTPVDELLADVDPFKRSNTRGTLATAKLPGRPNTATSQWFFNQADNSALDDDPENYTVFGRVNDRSSLAVMDAIGDLPIVDASGGQSGSAFGQLPVRNYASGAITDANLVFVNTIAIVPEATPPYALPFKLKKRQIAVKKANKRKLKVTVRRLPTGANVIARLRGGLAVASAPAGTARLTLPRRKGKLRVTVTPPGQKASSAILKVR